MTSIRLLKREPRHAGSTCHSCPWQPAASRTFDHAAICLLRLHTAAIEHRPGGESDSYASEHWRDLIPSRSSRLHDTHPIHSLLTCAYSLVLRGDDVQKWAVIMHSLMILDGGTRLCASRLEWK